MSDSLRARLSPGEQSDDEEPPESTELVDEPRFRQCRDEAGEMEAPESRPGLSGGGGSEWLPPLLPLYTLWFQSKRRVGVEARLQFSSSSRRAGELARDEGESVPRSR